MNTPCECAVTEQCECAEQLADALLDNLEEALGVVCTLCKRLNPQHAGCTGCMDTDHWRETIRRSRRS